MLTQEEMDEMINMIWPGPDSSVYTFGPQITHAEDIAKKAYEAQQMRKSFEAEERRYLDELKALAKGETQTWGDYGFIKEMRSGSVDYSKIPELQGVKLEDYRKDKVVVWKLIKLGK